MGLSRALSPEQLRCLMRDAVMRAAGFVLQRWRDEACRQDVYAVLRHGEKVSEMRVNEESMVGFLGSAGQLSHALESGVEDELWRLLEENPPPGMCIVPRVTRLLKGRASCPR